MFGFGFRPFEEDPFFRAHNERIRNTFDTLGRFDRGFGHDPFGHDPFALEGPSHEQDRQREGRNGQPGRHDRDLAPVDMFSGGMFGIGSMFRNMEEHFARAANDPNTFSYSQSSVMTYSNDGSGEPKYFQAHHSTKKAPGGIKETRRAVKDSESGEQRMAVGHHIGDRGHVVERSLNRRTGHEERKQDFINMDEENVDEFQNEWTRRTRAHDSNHLGDRHRHRHRALPEARDGRRNGRRERLAEHDRERRIRHQSYQRNRPREGLD